MLSRIHHIHGSAVRAILAGQVWQRASSCQTTSSLQTHLELITIHAGRALGSTPGRCRCCYEGLSLAALMLETKVLMQV
eukprot:scaffold496384_cov17-Prasinocladus_malaysianus.AAC.1